MNTFYSSERGIQILIRLLKDFGIKKIVTSPGTTNMMLNASLMYDGSFEMISSVDERSAAYMACGMAEERRTCYDHMYWCNSCAKLYACFDRSLLS